MNSRSRLKRARWYLAVLLLIVGGYILAAFLIPRDASDQDPGATFTNTQTIPGVGTGTP